MNLASMQDTLYDRLGYETAPAARVIARLTRLINETQREILGMRGLTRLRRTILTFPCVASTPFVTLPQSVVKMVTVQDRANGWTLHETSLQDLRYNDPRLAGISTYPYSYVVLNLAAAVSQDPSVAAELFVVSDSATDDNTRTAYLEGIDANGNYQTQTAVLSGLTPVTFTLTNWIIVQKFSLALTAGGVATALGNITLTQGSGGAELARITSGRSTTRYSRLHLYPTPTQVNTYYADVEIHFEDMVQATDEPYLPEDFHWLIVSGCLKKEYAKREKQLNYGIESGRFDKGVSALKLWLRSTTGVTARTTPRAFSQLGPWFPVGS